MIYETIFSELRAADVKLVGLAGPKGAGKSYVAGVLQTHCYCCRVGFADPLKRMLMTLGLTRAQCYSAGEKESPCDLLCGKTPRHAMQTLGTEWGRDMISNDVWVRATLFEIYRQMKNAPAERPALRFVIEDVRFPNEAKAIRQAGGRLWEVRRPGRSYDPGHASEAGLDESFDQVIVNDQDRAQLKHTALCAWWQSSWPHNNFASE